MKTKLFEGKGGRVWLAVSCVILAIIVWCAVKYADMGAPPLGMLILG